MAFNVVWSGLLFFDSATSELVWKMLQLQYDKDTGALCLL